MAERIGDSRPDRAPVPPTLRAFFDYGGDLDVVDDLEELASVVVRARRISSAEELEEMGHWHGETAVAWLRGYAVPELPWLPATTTPSPGHVRRYLWIAECLLDQEIAERLESRVPAEMLVGILDELASER